MMYQVLLYGLISFLLTLVTIPLFCKAAFFLKVVDIPDGKVKVHKKTTPYFGGVSIFFSLLAVSFIANLFNSFHFLFNFIGITILMLIGLYDDIYVTKPLHKLFWQILVSILFLIGGNALKISFLSDYFSYAITIFWFLTAINALNLVDIMDGLAGSISLFGCISFFCLAYYLNNNHIMIWLSILIGSLLGFLWYNKPQAKIYLGDAGSLMLGGILSLLPFYFVTLNNFNDEGFFTGIIILGIPLMETFLLIIIRTYKNKPFYLGSQDHSVCYLRNKGWDDKKILYFFIFLSLCLGFVAQMFFYCKISLFATTCSLFVLLLFSLFMIYQYKRII